MIKHRWISAKWSKKDAKYLSKKGITINENGGYNLIRLDEQDPIYQELKEKFLKQEREDFNDSHVASSFTQEEINGCEYAAFSLIEKGYPQPKPNSNGFLEATYVDFYRYSRIPKKGQQKPFILKGENKWNKKDKAFTFQGIYDALFVRTDFFEEFLAPLGYKHREVLVDTKGNISNNTVQWDLPVSNTRMKLNGTWYDWDHICPESGIKRYSHQLLDFLPSFEEKPIYDVFLSQEYFGEYGRSNRKFIANRKMIRFFFETGFLTSYSQLHPILNE
ncbi:MAG: hypothetical protein AAF348_18655 [Bacteroidota bacterium]